MKYIDEYYYSGLALVAAAMLVVASSGSDDSAGSSAMASLRTSITDAAIAVDKESAPAVSDKHKAQSVVGDWLYMSAPCKQ